MLARDAVRSPVLADQARVLAEAVGARPLAGAAARLPAPLQHGSPAQPWYPLSECEFEVARLIAAGLTNNQIAERRVKGSARPHPSE